MRTRLTPAVLILLLLAPPALAWNKPTHAVIGAFAYDTLVKEHPEVIPRVIGLLEKHPQWDSHIGKAVDAVPPEERGREAFMLMGRWADDIRSIPQYTHPAWHYIDFPVIAPGDPIRPPVPAAGDPNVLTALAASTAAVRGRGPDPDRAVALCWVFHLVGDVHQPLHTVSFFSSGQWPKGDRGGNDFHVRAGAGKSVIKLHALWDGLVLGSGGYRDVANEATALEKRPDLSRETLSADLAEKRPRQWAKESYDAAVKVAYLNGTLAGSADGRRGPVLPAGYLATAKATAERRVALAGYRLADALVAMFPADAAGYGN